MCGIKSGFNILLCSYISEAFHIFCFLSNNPRSVIANFTTVGAAFFGLLAGLSNILEEF